MDRRRFNKLCSSLLTGASALSLTGQSQSNTQLNEDTDQTRYPETLIIDRYGKPVKATELDVGSSHIFSYPFVTTPCFLLRLSAAPSDDNAKSNNTQTLADKNGKEYEWHGGVGEDKSIVAFSAICTHKMSHPAKPVSHLNFRPEEKTFFNSEGEKTTHSQLIYCCSEHSVYDPSNGARVLSGPASQPLAAIELKVNANDEILAVGSYGGNMYDVFLEKFGFRQAMEQGVSDPATLSGAHATAIPAADYSSLQILC